MEVVVRAPDVHVAAAPNDVGDVLADFSSHRSWTPSFRLRGSSPVQGSRVAVVAGVLPGPPAVIPAVVLRSERGTVLEWGGRVPGLVRLAHTFEFEAVGDGTRVVHQEVFEGPGAVAVKLVQRQLQAEYALMSERLRTRAEALAT
jgi:hypothetical protein